MFDRFDVRYKLAIIWLLVFAGLWLIFKNIFPMNSMDQQLAKIEESIDKKDWNKASEYAKEFKENFKRNKVFIQMNNSTEALTAFEQAVGELEITVRYKQDSAIEYIGALRETINFVIKPFSGP